MAIQFRDRALKEGEKSHYYCDECGCELHSDFAYSHKCNPILTKLNKEGKELVSILPNPKG